MICLRLILSLNSLVSKRPSINLEAFSGWPSCCNKSALAYSPEKDVEFKPRERLIESFAYGIGFKIQQQVYNNKKAQYINILGFLFSQ
jgi:hypothetical protein